MGALSSPRLPGVAGLVFVVLLVIGGFGVPDVPPAPADTPADFLAFLVDNRRMLLVLAGVNAIAVVPFFPFLLGLFADLREREGQGGVLAGSCLLGGVVAAALIGGGQSVYAGAAYLADYGLDDTGARTYVLISAVFFNAGYAAMAAFAFASGLILSRASDAWRWVGYWGYVVAVLAAVGSFSFAADGFFAPFGVLGLLVFVAFLVYVLAISVSMLRAAPGAR